MTSSVDSCFLSSGSRPRSTRYQLGPPTMLTSDVPRRSRLPISMRLDSLLLLPRQHIRLILLPYSGRCSRKYRIIRVKRVLSTCIKSIISLSGHLDSPKVSPRPSAISHIWPLYTPNRPLLDFRLDRLRCRPIRPKVILLLLDILDPLQRAWYTEPRIPFCGLCEESRF